MRGILKKELAIFAMLLSFAVVFSQNTQDVYSDVVNYLDYLTVRTSSITDAVISGRSYGDNQGNVYGEFIKFDQNLSASRQITIDNFGVNDFCVLDGCVYFCGGTRFGYFNESDFNNTAVFNATTFSLPVDFVSKIKVYIDEATQIVTVAIVGGGYNNNCSDAYIVDESVLIVGQINGSTFDYCKYVFPETNLCYYSFNVHFQDVVLTDEYIVAVGVETLTNQNIILSRIAKSNLSTMDYFIFTDPANSAVESPTVLESLDGNNVAFSSLYMDVSNSKFYARVYFCDMNTFANQCIQDVLLPQKTMPDDLLFLPFDSTLLLLLTSYDYPGIGDVSSTVYYLDCNANSSYVADFMYDENLRLYSLDRLPDSHFVVGGKNLSDMRHYVVRDKQAGAVSQCHRYATTGVSIEPIITGIQNTAVATEDNAPQKITKCTPSDIVLYSDCSE